MAGVVEVAEYVLDKVGAMTTMKLQKLIYYSQAWHLAWTEEPLFSAKIEAWRNGPVLPELFELHKGHFKLKPGFLKKKLGKVKFKQLSANEKDIINRVILFYGDKDPHWLSQLSHMEDPWKKARACNSEDENSSNEISHQSMFEYYSSL